MARTCESCGADPGEGSFCQHCGTPLTGETPAPAPPVDPTPQQPPVQPPATPPQQPQYQPAPPQRSGFLKGCLIVGAIGVAAVIVGGFFIWRFVSNEVLPELDETTDAFTAFSDAPPGPCFDVVAEGGVLIDWTEVSCDGPRQVEVTFAAAFEDGPFPGDAYLTESATTTCLNAFENYVGLTPEQSSYDYDWLLPTEDQWTNGLRNGICLVVADDGSTLTGTVKGSEQ